MAKLSQSKQLIERIAALEQFVCVVKEAQAAADYHQNEAVDLSVINAESALSEAVKSLAQYDRPNTAKLLNVAWFYAKFAQDILAAEATEHILGQGTYLDLVETPKQVQTWFEDTAIRLEKRLLSYEGELLDASSDQEDSK
ncbi:MAG: hypothetical protein WCT03_25530 [Candidatus Obscuribacterales bacterium]|jgi:hypothetical protein